MPICRIASDKLVGISTEMDPRLADEVQEGKFVVCGSSVTVS